MNELKASEVVIILKAAKQAGVSKLYFGNLHVEFGGTPVADTLTIKPIEALPDVNVNLSDSADKINLAPEIIEEIETANRLVEDPQAFERQMIAESLERERLSGN